MMKNDSPLLSIGLPVYNGGRFLRGALTSILQQSFSDFELIISDNASTDDTPTICAEFARYDGRIRYSRNETNIGLARNHNRTFLLSRGRYFKWAAHDDEYDPAMLSTCVDVLERVGRHISVVYCAAQIIDALGNPTAVRSDRVASSDPRPSRRLARFLNNHALFNFSFGVIRSDILRLTPLYGAFPVSDVVLFAELAMRGGLYEVDEPLLRLRFHEGRSFEAHKAPHALWLLFDPAAGGSRMFQSIAARVRLELLKTVWRVPNTSRERAALLAVAVGVPLVRTVRKYGGRQRRKVLQALLSRQRRIRPGTHIPPNVGDWGR